MWLTNTAGRYWSSVDVDGREWDCKCCEHDYLFTNCSLHWIYHNHKELKNLCLLSGKLFQENFMCMNIKYQHEGWRLYELWCLYGFLPRLLRFIFVSWPISWHLKKSGRCQQSSIPDGRHYIYRHKTWAWCSRQSEKVCDEGWWFSETTCYVVSLA